MIEGDFRAVRRLMPDGSYQNMADEMRSSGLAHRYAGGVQDGVVLMGARRRSNPWDPRTTDIMQPRRRVPEILTAKVLPASVRNYSE
jgi:hypothetical protein